MQIAPNENKEENNEKNQIIIERDYDDIVRKYV